MSDTNICNQLILEGNFYFNQQNYEKSAKQYEKAGEWAIQNSLSKEIIFEAFDLALSSWISACKVDNVFRILEKETFEGKYEMLKDLYPKIEKMVEHQINKKRMEKTAGDKLLDKFKKKLIEIKPNDVQKEKTQIRKKPFSGKKYLEELKDIL